MGISSRGRTVRRAAIASAIAALLCASLGSCSQKEQLRSEAVASSSAVTFSAGAVQLAGRLFGTGDARAGVVLAHMLPADQTAWFDLAARLAGRGYRVLTFNFRGYCPGGDGGCSEGERDVGSAPTDLAAAVAFLRTQGVAMVAVVGASFGGSAALVVAGREGDAIEAVMTLSAPEVIEDLSVTNETLAAITAAKLYVAASGDTVAAAAAQRFYDITSQPKRLEIVTSDDHGTDLLEGNQGANVRNLIESFLLSQMAPAGAG